MIMMDDPRFRFHAYCDQQSIPLIGVSGEQPTDPEFVLHFSETATQEQISSANDICFKTPTLFGGWQPLPVPDWIGFQKAIVTDTTIPIATKLSIPGLIALIQPLTGFFDKPTLQSLWKDAKADSGKAGWLSGKTSDGELITGRVEKYASQNGISVV